MKVITESESYNEVISDENIFSAVYSLDSYIFEVNLLNEEDLNLFYKLKDKYNKGLIEKVITECKEKLKKVLKTDELFNIEVFFKAKKYNKEKAEVECRPMHTADLITQICIVCLLNVVMFKKDKNGKRELSDLSQLLPSNFFGNLPCTEPERIFYDWKIKYKAYTEKVIQSYDAAKSTGAYKYEVCLDLEKYFPSINPNFIYNFSLEKLGVIYKDSELECLKVILKKLLYFNVSNLNSPKSLHQYYKDCSNEIKDKFHPNIGIPQGLPQAYFFGNICMIPISKEFDKTFPGESFFYVDDSVIYTNHDSAKIKNFENTLKSLNLAIARSIDEYVGAIDSSSVNENIYRFSKKISYKILVHEKEKSTTAEIDHSFKMSRAYLMPMALEASRVSFDVNNTFDSIQDINLYKKIEALGNGLDVELKSVTEEIRTIDDKIELVNKSDADSVSFNLSDLNARKDAFESYAKSLKRYKKFFLYRKRLLEFRKSSDINKTLKEFEKKYFFEGHELSIKQIKDIFDKFDEDIFLAEAQLIYSNIIEKERQNQFKISLEKFEQSLVSNISKENLYFAENFKKKEFLKNEYATLEKIAQELMPNFSKRPSDLKVAFLKKEFNSLDSPRIYTSDIWLGYGTGYDKDIFYCSKEYKRKILNTYISKIFNVELSNNIESSRRDKRALKYYELRILTYIRNRNYDLNCFYDFIRRILSDYSENSYEKVDFSLYDVLDLFLTYVKDPNLIDKLILVHKYISSIWRNGSRFLYFYTLHNHEHSVELIISTVNICKTIDYLQIKNLDYYILFLSCYLHDISMVLQPDINLFTQENFKTDEVYTSFLEIKKQLESEMLSEKQKEKTLMKQSFEKVSNYFETLVRDNHARDSASFIKNNGDLDFLELPIRAIVSAVSEAHNYNPTDVYGLKSTAKSDVASEKYMMILLRIADLLDISKDRVSLNILRHNIKNMPEISQYHWITHAAIDRFQIKSTYEFIGHSLQKNDFIRLLKKQNLIETITVEIFLNASNLTKVESLNCENARATLTESSDSIMIELGKDKKCDAGQCNFLCKWMLKKNEYLLKELNSLQLYLDRNVNNIFTTKINIKLNFTEATPLSGDHFDIVSKQIF